ncbi:carboxypeptidase regulatory-like domain-containing protein [Kribbella sp. NPDC051586]|uniref:carboxypeptidase regulatory-like domain-containing protein n=1 Tax=Kribbella sp. NPDC051586 TaxID=3364118 RepID=UPI003791A20A
MISRTISRASGLVMLTLAIVIAGVGLARLPAAAQPAHAGPAIHPSVEACPRATKPGVATCLALRRTDVPAKKGLVADGPAGYGPEALQSAYSLPSRDQGSGQTIAVVDAYDDATAEADLATYRSQFGLPACTSASGCFRKVDQRGGTDYPQADTGWSQEISLDLDMVSAACPNCSILLVEADDPELESLGLAVDEAVALGAKYVSNSYGAPEDPSETSVDPHFNHPGVAVTASTGDSGFGTSYPAASPYVTAVGGTSLVVDSGPRTYRETAWSGAGSGCSIVEPKPAWQTDTGCPRRSAADVSAVADPNTGVAVYTSTLGGWTVFGGTSASAPLIAATYALAGPPVAGTTPTSYLYETAAVDQTSFYDVTSGANGSCTVVYECVAGTGYDGPTGIGTPRSEYAFKHHPHGQITGTVTDASGVPLAGADVTVAAAVAHTNADGHYSLNVPVGSFQVTATKYPYQPLTATVAVPEGTVTQDFSLTLRPKATISGVVSDGSGHGWPLYAKVTASDGTVAFTDPSTGRYQMLLPQEGDYTLTIGAVSAGYSLREEKVTLGNSDLTRDSRLTVEVGCAAPGYQAKYAGTTQAFSGKAAPTGWTVTNLNPGLPGYAHQPGWQFTNPGQRPNRTGGTGNYAIVDSDRSGPAHVQDTLLTGPTTDLTSSAAPAVQFATELVPAVNSTATVELSTDAGQTWTTIWRRAGMSAASGVQIVPVPQAAHQKAVRVRFHYLGSWSQWWGVDDVFLGNRICTAPAGGLLVGQVTGPSGGINGATVGSVTKPEQYTATMSTPDDPNVGDGFYQLFTTATGAQKIAATATGHPAVTMTTTVAVDRTTRLDFTLK